MINLEVVKILALTVAQQFIIRIAEALPYYGNLTAQTKDTLLREALIEIIVLRAASCYNTESDGIKSINGAEYNIQTLQRGGATSAFTSFLREFMDAVTKLKLKECDFAILSIMCLMSPDRGTEVGKRDRQQLCRIQVRSGVCLLIDAEKLGVHRLRRFSTKDT